MPLQQISGGRCGGSATPAMTTASDNPLAGRSPSMSNLMVFCGITDESKVQLDAAFYSIGLGCQGFHSVPYGLHYVKVEQAQGSVSGWCYLQSNQGVLCTVQDQQLTFEPLRLAPAAEPQLESPMPSEIARAAHSFQDMNVDLSQHFLRTYNYDRWVYWLSLTHRVHHQYFPSILELPLSSQYLQGRSKLLLLSQCQDDWPAFLAEFQIAFLKSFVVFPSAVEQELAFRYWHLFIEFMSALGMANCPTQYLLMWLSDLQSQLAVMGSKLLNPTQPTLLLLGKLAERLSSGANADLARSGQQLLTLLEARWGGDRQCAS